MIHATVKMIVAALRKTIRTILRMGLDSKEIDVFFQD